MRKILLEITAADIAGGEQADCARCPIALAMMRRLGEFPGAFYVTAGSDFLTFGGIVDNAPFHFARAGTPPECAGFMRLFDAGFTPQPFAIEVEFHESPAPDPARIQQRHALAG